MYNECKQALSLMHVQSINCLNHISSKFVNLSEIFTYWMEYTFCNEELDVYVNNETQVRISSVELFILIQKKKMYASNTEYQNISYLLGIYWFVI